MRWSVFPRNGAGAKQVTVHALVVSVGIALMAAPVNAQSDQPVAPEEHVTVTATRFETPLEDVGASVTVITADDLERLQVGTVGDALRLVPGLTVLQSGSPGATTSVGIRGAHGTQIQVIVDGVKIKSTTNGTAEFGDLTTDNVDRIEILRGPQSTLYGADAIGGVVNIITRRGQGPLSGQATVGGGNYGTVRERLAWQGATGRFDWSLGGSYHTTAGRFANDAYREGSGAVQLGLALPGQGRLALSGRFQRDAKDIPFKNVFPNFDANRGQVERSNLGSLRWSQPWSKRWDSDLTLSDYRDRLDFSDPADPGTSESSFQSRIDVRRFGAEWYSRVHLGSRSSLTLGAEWRSERGDNVGTFDREVSTHALVAQDEAHLSDHLVVTAGVRTDDHSAFGTKTTPRVALSYALPESSMRLKGSWGEGFRAPTLNELYFPAFGGCPSFGNPSLKPETSRSFDAGIELRFPQSRLWFEATYFQNGFQDLIEFALIDPLNFCFQAQNVGRAQTRGAETQITAVPAKGLALSLAFTHQDTRDLDSGLELRRFPRNRAVATLSWARLRSAEIHARVSVQSSHFEASGRPRTAGYTVVDLGGHYDVFQHGRPAAILRLFASVGNILDERYQEVQGFPALGRNFLAGAEFRF